MTFMTASLVLAWLAPPLFSTPTQKPEHGKVRIYVTADTEHEGVKQRASELEESARDLRVHLKKQKWLEPVTEEAAIETADIRFRVLARRKDPEKGFVLRYHLDAGAFKTEDEFSYEGEALATGGTRALGFDGFSNATEGRQHLKWGELAKHLAASLNNFAEANYQRIINQRDQKAKRK